MLHRKTIHRYDLDCANRHRDVRHRRRALRMWLRGLVLMRLPDLLP
jgi:hypothetical protein